MLGKRTLMALVAALVVLAGTGYSVTGSARWGNGDCGGVGGTGPLSETEIADLVFMREEEKLARDVYLALGEEWTLLVFANISESEQRHMDAIKKLLDKYAISDPVEVQPEPGKYVDQDLQALYDFLIGWGMESMMDGLYVGGAIEEVDIQDIQLAIDRTDPAHEDIIGTYESLMCGSRNHLRAFVRTIELYGEVYTPFLLSQAQVDAIVDTPMERGCGSNHRRGNGNGKGPG